MNSLLIKNGRVFSGEGFILADLLTCGDKIEPNICDDRNRWTNSI